VGGSREKWLYVSYTHLTGVYNVTKRFVPGMVRRKWGRIINLASCAGKAGTRYMSAYVASKHGVIGLTRALAVELVQDGITVNAICPASVETQMVEKVIANIVLRTKRSEVKARHH
jgi:NAD(P)-dependent dehydrogenase (short-subunit alcohol dehydrogenase family)